MAAPSSANVKAARGVATGALSWWKKGATAPTLPTSSTTALNAGFVALGIINSDGITGARDVSTDDVKDMNGATVLSLQTDFSRTYSATLLSTSDQDVKKLVFGDANVTVTAATTNAGTKIAAVDKGEVGQYGALVVDTFYGSTHHREVAPNCQVSSVEFSPLVGTAALEYTVTWTVYADASGNFVYEYEDDGVFSA